MSYGTHNERGTKDDALPGRDVDADNKVDIGGGKDALQMKELGNDDEGETIKGQQHVHDSKEQSKCKGRIN